MFFELGEGVFEVGFVAGYDGVGGAVGGGDGEGGGRCGVRSVGERLMEAMAPWPVILLMALLRRVMILAASGRVSAPAMWAAAISPWECPMTAVGWTPSDFQSSAREIIMAKRVGWIMWASVMSLVCWRVSVRDQPVRGSRAAAHLLMWWAKTGEVVRSSVAIPGHWAPWPGRRRRFRGGCGWWCRW